MTVKNYTKIFYGTESGEVQVDSYEEYLAMKLADGGEKIVYVVYKNDNNRPHRTDGPALETNEGKQFFWLNGKLMHEPVYKEQLKLLEQAENNDNLP